MNKFTIATDSACDIKPELLDKWGVKYASLTSYFDGEEEIPDVYIDLKNFYDRMRNGESAKTSGVNVDTFKNLFENELKKDTDVLYLGFSSGLSVTFHSAEIAAEELMEKYPDRKVICVDSLSASAGFGLLLYLTLKKRSEGATIEETVSYVKETRSHLCHWFTVDDLVYLKRGGRISPAMAFVGGMLGIKPIMHMDNDGKLVNVSKVRGRKASLKAIVDKYGELAINKKEDTVFICHGDCPEDVKTLRQMLKKEYNVEVKLVTEVGPVIGAHSGPGAISIFFLGKER